MSSGLAQTAGQGAELHSLDSEWQGFLDCGTRVINNEGKALGMLADSLDENFCRAIDILAATRGRVIVSGMGKSGIICRKIAATLASTGQPAQFVHPAEASHGDLGMLADGDSVIVFSNSGETPELADIMAYTRRFGIPLIGISGRGESEVMQLADVGILLPPCREACPTGVVPTTSTIMMLALGDALAVTLMEHRGFTSDSFHRFHPGGSLGARLSKVSDLMHTGDSLPLVNVHTSMQDALLVMTQKGFGVAGVTNDNVELVGIITDGDLRRHLEGLLSKRADDVMTHQPLVITPDALAQEALAIMNSREVTCLLVVNRLESRNLVGIIHIHDCLRAGVA